MSIGPVGPVTHPDCTQLCEALLCWLCCPISLSKSRFTPSSCARLYSTGSGAEHGWGNMRRLRRKPATMWHSLVSFLLRPRHICSCRNPCFLPFPTSSSWRAAPTMYPFTYSEGIFSHLFLTFTLSANRPTPTLNITSPKNSTTAHQ